MSEAVWCRKIVRLDTIYRELCKKLKFVPINKWYMHNQESVLAKETHKLLWDFEIRSDQLQLVLFYQKIGKRTRGLGNNGTRGHNLNNGIAENSHNTDKSSGDLRRLVVTQTLLKVHQLKLMRKTLKK